MENFLNDVKTITKELEKIGYSKEQILGFLNLYFNAKNSGMY